LSPSFIGSWFIETLFQLHGLYSVEQREDSEWWI